jgi:tetratricopeptide (TPR) repeat protein
LNSTRGASATSSRLARLQGYLAEDPGNLSLIADAAAAALDEQNPITAAELLDQYEALAPLPPPLLNLRGLAAMSLNDFSRGLAIFEPLRLENPQDSALKFNLAWCRAMLEDFAGAAELLDDAVIDSNPRAASLRIEALHHLGRYDEALDQGAALAALRPADKALMGALATLALDADRIDLAARYGAQAGDNPDGLAARGMVAMDGSQIDDALVLFKDALQARPDNPRALLGLGLGTLAQGDPLGAAGHLSQAAGIFGDHLGTWVAAGWAYYVAGDYRMSRTTFEHALALDDTFAETHGGLAVLDVVEGNLESARRRTEVALRLDRRCFSATLARSLLLAAEGDQASAEQVRNIAMNVPIGPDGRTIAQSIVAMGVNSRRGARKPD